MGLKVATFNISGGFYGGDESTEYFDRAAAKAIDNRLLKQIIEIINDEDLDVIAFQEIITTPEIGYISAIVEATQLKNVAEFETSECNLVEGTRCGVAVFSKYPLKNIEKHWFPNPKLSKTTESGNTYYSYDKGIIVCDIEAPSGNLRFLTHHNFPFGRFNSKPEDYPEVFTFFDDLIAEKQPDVVTGDFNVLDFMKLMPKLANDYRRTIDDVTTVDGKKIDDIVVRKDASCESRQLKTLSDHNCIIGEL